MNGRKGWQKDFSQWISFFNVHDFDLCPTAFASDEIVWIPFDLRRRLDAPLPPAFVHALPNILDNI